MMRIVVVGHGMVGARFVDEVTAAVPDASVTVLGKEDRPPYNRVLLSSVVSGDADPRQLSLAAPPRDGVAVHPGVAAVGVDRDRRVVSDANGEEHAYDHLVLATGSTARIPAIQGVAEGHGLVDGVFVLKDLADAEGVVAASGRARGAIVLGAGVLGIEVATGLAARGVATRLVHLAERLMNRQLGWEASAAVSTSLRDLGIDVHTGASIARVHTRRGRMTGVRLEDGSTIEADMLVMCCGTVPETSLARRARLDVGTGVTVGADLASPTDPRIAAIGDCAEPPTGATGLVATGWDQAARLARRLAGSDVGEVGSRTRPTDVVRVKARGLKVTSMGIAGDFDRTDPRWRVVTLNDPAAGRFVEVVVSGGILAGATVVGDAAVSASLSALYARSLPVPTDPAVLMIGSPVVAAPRDPDDLGDDDLVCQCNSVTAGGIRAAVADGCATVDAVAGATRASTGCGDCATKVRALIEKATTEEPAATAAAT